MEPRKKPQSIQGKVVSDKMDKTRVIEIQSQNPHSLYGKRVHKREKLFVHDEKNQSKQGDVVEAVLVRPMSRHKHHRMVRIVQTGSAT